MIDKIIKAVITVIGTLLGVFTGVLLNQNGLLNFTEFQNVLVIIGISLVFGIIFFLLSTRIKKIGLKVVGAFETELLKFSTMDIIWGALGLIVGFIIAFLISQPFSDIKYVGTIISILSYLIFGYLGIKISTRKKDDVIWPQINLKKTAVSKKQDRNSKKETYLPKILDTSVIIDGRISDICKTGFIEGTLVIPEFVLKELRHIADSSDSLKRNRGRRGLDILNILQKDDAVHVVIESKDYGDNIEVDVKLLKLAKELGGKVLTNDFNLNKVAEFQGVEVLNINELANAVKPVVLPGEEMTVMVVKDGKESGQGLAYLDDGTMIVVEGGKKCIGDSVVVTVTSVLQTAAGRMIFAKLKNVINKAV
ncbi:MULTISPECIES: PIN/TRAM domain-containing protein [unclassified Sedimentibacter]|uniref:PIN/TRAM domain-containing protein n=1 Tax=unclassified Sedimentibacter TaxID=2649220 RepID=UPI0027E17B0A|nr:PIN domain-containing protein [Sedimentibacter sp. MB35-C1]WMJ75702.1 TRAM domain-containing protein [Sedimentibacter sp. MB35-C1]